MESKGLTENKYEEVKVFMVSALRMDVLYVGTLVTSPAL